MLLFGYFLGRNYSVLHYISRTDVDRSLYYFLSNVSQMSNALNKIFQRIMFSYKNISNLKDAIFCHKPHTTSVKRGRDMVQADSRRLLAAEARARGFAPV
jgi:hypothetical protein